MIKQELEQWLASMFEVQINELKNQTTDTLAENVIYYTLSGSPIEVRPPTDLVGPYSFHYTVTLLVRAPTGEDMIGYLSTKLADLETRIDEMQIELNDSTELIEDDNIECQVISKTFSVTHTISESSVKEKIKAIDLTIRECE